MPYKAFISYSHAADGQLAPTLQSALHRFAKPFYRLRALRVFRDKTSLHLTQQLWPLIQSALAESEYFLLLASPDAARSPWVQNEVDEWLRLKNESLDKFLVVLTGGEILWDAAAGDFDWSKTTALPPNLRGKFKKEPLYSDLRWASKATDLSLRHPQFLEEIGSIGSTLHGRPKDELVGQDVRQHRVFKLAALVVALVLVVLTAAASAAAFYANAQRKEAVAQRQEAVKQRNEADAQALEARRQRDEAERQRALADESAKKEREAKDAAEESAAKEKLARQNETEQRRKAERATENERVARVQAEERRKEAERQSNIAFSRELASNADAQLRVDPEVSALLAVEAVKVTPTEQAEEALRRAASESRLRAVMRVSVPEGKLSNTDPRAEGRYVYDAAFSPDGRYVATASSDMEPRVWDAQTGALVSRMEGHTGSVWRAEFSPDSRLLLTCGDFTARLWDVKTGAQVRQMFHDNDPQPSDGNFVIYAAFSRDGSRVVTASYDHTARVWETATGRQVSVMRGHESPLNGAAFSPDGRYVATAGDDSTARVWDAETGKAVSVLKGHKGIVRTAVFSPDGRLVVTASYDKTARVWNALTGEAVAELRGHMGAVLGAVFSPRGDYVLTAGEDGAARVWEPRTGKVVAELRGHTKAVTRAAFSPDGGYIITAAADNTARVWEASFPAGGEEEQEVETDPLLATPRQVRWQSPGVLRGHSGPLFSAVFSPDGSRVVTASTDGTARVWDATFPQNLEQLHDPAFEVMAAAFSPDGRYIATAHHDDHVRVWDAQTGRRVALLHEDDEADWFTAFSHDGKFLLTSTGDGLFVWEAGTWRNITRLAGGRGASFSPDNKYVLSGNALWEAGTWRKLPALPEGEEDARFSPDARFVVTSLRGGKTRVRQAGAWNVVADLPSAFKGFSPDGALMLTRAREDSAAEEVWDARTWRRSAVLPEGGDVWSADGRLVVSTNGEGRDARVWEARTGRRLTESGGHETAKKTGVEEEEHGVRAAAFSPDGRLLVTAGSGKTARVWDAATGRELSVLLGREKDLTSAAFSPDGRLVATGDEGGTVRVWDAASGLSLAVYGGDSEEVKELAFSPGGRFVLTNPHETGAQVYACAACYTREDVLGVALAHVTRALTAEERGKYLHQSAVR